VLELAEPDDWRSDIVVLGMRVDVICPASYGGAHRLLDVNATTQHTFPVVDTQTRRQGAQQRATDVF